MPAPDLPLAKQQELLIPLSPMGLGKFLRSRLGIRQRKGFWLTLVVVTVFLALNSAMLRFFIMANLSQFCRLIPWLAPYSNLVYSWGRDPRAASIAHPGPVDELIILAGGVTANFFADNSQTLMMCWLVPSVTAMIVLLLLIRPSYLGISAQGLRLHWRKLIWNWTTAHVSWSDLKYMYVEQAHRAKAQHLSDLVFEFREVPAMVTAFTPVEFAKRGALNINMSKLTNQSKERLLALAQQHAPENTIDSTVLEALTPVETTNYTELWLNALTAPAKRQRFDPVPPGTMLKGDQYKVVGQLGVGGQGIAYLGLSADSMHTLLMKEDPDKSLAALKAETKSADLVLKEFILPLYVDADSRKSALKHFIQEAEMLKALDNPRIVKLVDCFVEDHRAYLVLERIHGASLREIVEKGGPLSEERVRNLAIQMCDILNYLHSRTPPVVHRDFTPDNLILGKDGVLKLVDFNVAQQEVECNVTGTIVGKQSYIPPEQVRGMSNSKSDIYAMGATLYFLLTGSDPEPLTSSQPAADGVPVSAELNAMIARATAMDEHERLQNTSEIMELLQPGTRIDLRQHVEEPST